MPARLITASLPATSCSSAAGSCTSFTKSTVGWPVNALARSARRVGTSAARGSCDA
jgi:hypothetical protein